jgi:hypothetical protein
MRNRRHHLEFWRPSERLGQTLAVQTDVSHHDKSNRSLPLAGEVRSYAGFDARSRSFPYTTSVHTAWAPINTRR